jgi:hypothetical protein
MLLSIVVILFLSSCKINENKPTQVSDTVITIEESDDEGRPMFTVKLANGTVYEHFYAEEIAQGLLDGQWKNNQDLTITETSEYQLFLEDDSLMIYSFDRLVAAVPYHQTGVLDSIFITDNL